MRWELTIVERPISSPWEPLKTSTVVDEWDMMMVNSWNSINLQQWLKLGQQKEQVIAALYINKEICNYISKHRMHDFYMCSSISGVKLKRWQSRAYRNERGYVRSASNTDLGTMMAHSTNAIFDFVLTWDSGGETRGRIDPFSLLDFSFSVFSDALSFVFLVVLWALAALCTSEKLSVRGRLCSSCFSLYTIQMWLWCWWIRDPLSSINIFPHIISSVE